MPCVGPYADSLPYVWYITIAFGGVGIILCAFLPNIRRFMTDRVAVVGSISNSAVYNLLT